MKLVIQMPEDVMWIIQKLNQAGHEAYAVGGCVRDSILGKRPKDWDVTTSAQPEQVKEIFDRTIDTGIEHGTVTVLKNHIGYEVTTYRIDGEYLDGRHPEQVEFTTDLKEDLKRRDFTINAMAYHHQTGLIDIFGGMKDIERKQIRCVGAAADRFSEDALRMMRAIRFSAQLGFGIEKGTYAAVTQLAEHLELVSKERIQTELTKTLVSGHPEMVELTAESGLAPFICDGFLTVFEGERYLSAKFPESRWIRWAAFFYHLEAEAAELLLRQLKMDHLTIDRVKLLLNWKRDIPEKHKPSVRKMMSQMEPEEFDDVVAFRLAADQPDGHWQEILGLAAAIRRSGDCLYLKDLKVTGKDLIECGMKPGKELGARLARMLEAVLECPENNRREYLLEQIL